MIIKFITSYQYARFLKSHIDPELADKLGFYDYNESILANQMFKAGEDDNKLLEVFNETGYGWYKQDLYLYEDSVEPDDWTWSYAEIPTRKLVEILEKNIGHKFFIPISEELLDLIPVIKKGGRWRTKGKILGLKSPERETKIWIKKNIRNKRKERKNRFK